MKNEFFVNSGEIAVCQENGILRAEAIGSCVVVKGMTRAFTSEVQRNGYYE